VSDVEERSLVLRSINWAIHLMIAPRLTIKDWLRVLQPNGEIRPRLFH
jgi:hypothetical protein